MATINGTATNDTLEGTAGNDWLNGSLGSTSGRELMENVSGITIHSGWS